MVSEKLSQNLVQSNGKSEIQTYTRLPTKVSSLQIWNRHNLSFFVFEGFN